MTRQDIEQEISRLESCVITYPVLEKLSVLYVIRQNLDVQEIEPYSHTAEPSSDFAKGAMRVTKERLIEIMDEHMKCVQILYPKEYDLIMEKLYP